MIYLCAAAVLHSLYGKKKLKIITEYRQFYTLSDHSKPGRIRKLHYWFNSYCNLSDQWVDFGYWCCFIREGLLPARLTNLVPNLYIIITSLCSYLFTFNFCFLFSFCFISWNPCILASWHLALLVS